MSNYKILILELQKINVITSKGRINNNVNKILKRNPIILKDLLKQTQFLNIITNEIQISMRIRCVRLNISVIPTCIHPECNENVMIKKKHISEYCSLQCARNSPIAREKYEKTCMANFGTRVPLLNSEIKAKAKATCQERYGYDYPLLVPEFLEQIKKTNIEKYGTEKAISSKIIREKIEKTNIEKYGCKSPLGNKRIKEQTKKTMLENHGVEYPLQSPEILNKTLNTNMRLYGFKHPSERADVRAKTIITNQNRYDRNHYEQQHIDSDDLKKLNNKEWIYAKYITNEISVGKIAILTGTSRSYIIKKLHSMEIPIRRVAESSIEIAIRQYVSSLNVNTVLNDTKILNGKEIDILIPEYNIGIEVNGVYWHSELKGKDSKYHLNKTMLAKEKGITLIHIFDFEWETQQDIIKSRLSNLLGKNERFFARKCKIVNVSKQSKTHFLNVNHLQGNVGSVINYGLIYDDELVAVMTFGKTRFSKQYEYELLRFVTKIGINIVGGASRLFSHFIKEINPKSVVTYGDLRYGSGQLYAKLGFEFLHHSNPNYFYFKSPRKLLSRLQFQKHKLEAKLDVFNPALTEWQNMVQNGYNRVWDCGNTVWIWKQTMK